MTSALLEMHGHLIDSLLLAKVIDRIQGSGYDYVVADLCIGARKQDISTAQITVWAPTAEDLEVLLVELRVHGVHRVVEEEARFVPVTQAGQAPAGAYLRHIPVSQVLHQGHWQSVAGSNTDWATVLAHNGPRLAPLQELQVGDQVLVGQKGVRSLAALKP